VSVHKVPFAVLRLPPKESHLRKVNCVFGCFASLAIGTFWTDTHSV